MSLVGGLRYDASLPFVEAFDYIMKLGEQYPMMVLGECLYSYRVLANSITRRDPIRREQYVREALRRACVRRSLEYNRVFPRGPTGGLRSKNSVLDNNIAAHFISSVLDQREKNHRLGALRTGLECVRLHPMDTHYYKALVYALVSPSVVRYLYPGLWQR